MNWGELQWVPAPIEGSFHEGRRWRLTNGRRDFGRVVQLLPGGLWEGYSGEWATVGHSNSREAARAVVAHLESTPSD